jgi:DNA-binding phage protein
MNSVKVSTRKYHDYLIESLRDPVAAAAYLTAILEESDPEPDLLSNALNDVVTALGTPELQAKVAQLEDCSAIMQELNQCLAHIGLHLEIKSSEELI